MNFFVYDQAHLQWRLGLQKIWLQGQVKNLIILEEFQLPNHFLEEYAKTSISLDSIV